MNRIRVLIADDHAVVRIGLTALFEAERDMAVVGNAKNGNEAVAQALTSHPDVVIMDLRMPQTDGVTATQRLLARLPDVKVLILTSFGESDGVAHALEAGAFGAVTKTAEDAFLVSVVRRIAAGEHYISAEIKKLLKDSPPVPKMTSRQQEILFYLAKGLTNRDIADLLHIRVDSVEEHVNLILAKLDAANRTEAVAIALLKHLLKT